MANVLGLIAFVGYVAAIIGIAAAVTWVVVRLTPPSKPGGSAET